MLSKVLIGSLLSAIALAADTCNPLTSSSQCSPNPALAGSISEDFTEESSQFSAYQKADRISYTSSGLELTLAERFDNPSLKSNFYIMFGRVELIVRAASGTGVVSSVFLQSDDLDEIDIEWFGGDGYEVQSNYFSKGDTTTYDRGGYHNMGGDPRADFHNYTLVWTEESLTWYVDGVNVRVLQSDNPEGYPQTPSAVFIGLWAGGDPSNAPGTIDWAGGETDYSQLPFTMAVQRLVVVDYSTGEEYSYGDSSGDLSSIQATNGEINGRQEQADNDFFELVNGGTVSSSSRSTSTSTRTSTSSSSTATTSSTSTTSSSSSSSSSTSTTSRRTTSTRNTSTRTTSTRRRATSTSSSHSTISSLSRLSPMVGDSVTHALSNNSSSIETSSSIRQSTLIAAEEVESTTSSRLSSSSSTSSLESTSSSSVLSSGASSNQKMYVLNDKMHFFKHVALASGSVLTALLLL